MGAGNLIARKTLNFEERMGTSLAFEETSALCEKAASAIAHGTISTTLPSLAWSSIDFNGQGKAIIGTGS